MKQLRLAIVTQSNSGEDKTDPSSAFICFLLACLLGWSISPFCHDFQFIYLYFYCTRVCAFTFCSHFELVCPGDIKIHIIFGSETVQVVYTTALFFGVLKH